MNIRFIILKAGNQAKKSFDSENYEICWGSRVTEPDNRFRATEFPSYEDAFDALQRVREQHKDCSYRLACVWGEV